jgi:hypothetical protein
MRRGVLLLALALAVAGCGSSANKTTRTTTIPATTVKPDIVKFDGPQSVSCGKKGTVKTVSFSYETRNATSVEPKIDGESPGMQAGYEPRRGTMHFSFICPGPHTLAIAAFNQKGQSQTKSVSVSSTSGGSGY